VESLTWKQALAWRMDRHNLVRRAPAGDMLEVAARICGVHAQVMSSAELTLWARVDELERDAVQRALWDDRALVKLWAMRGTLHLLPAAELGMWLAGLGSYEHYLKPVWLRSFEITREELEELIEAIGAALDGELRTPASYRGMLCFGPGEGQRVRFTKPAAWLPDGVEPVEQDVALRDIARRYLGAFAPVTRDDLARWWAVSAAQAGRMIAALGDEVAQVDVEGETYWMLAGHVAEAAEATPRNIVRLLPGFDQWVVGASRTAPAQLDPEHKARVYRPQGWLSPVLLVNGRMEGVWRHERKGRRLIVELEPFGRLPRWARTQAEREASRLADFLGGELSLSWTA
jgi:uncharacterized protein YcaQ